MWGVYKETVSDEEAIFVKYVSDKRLVSKIYRKQTQQDKKEFQTTQLENSWTVILPEGYTDSK